MLNEFESKMLEFINLVIQMRAAQQQYFSTRSPIALAKAKRLEKQVDEIAAEISSHGR
jgi:hypothetical protein